MRRSLLIAVIACSHPAPAPPAPAWQLDRSTLDASADPCADFYQYACGGFAREDRIPADREFAEWAADRAEVANEAALVDLLTGRDHGDDPELARLRTFYGSCTAADTTARATLSRWLARIDGIASRADLLAVVRDLHAAGIAAFFTYDGEADPHDRSRYRGAIDRGALGPRRMYADRDEAADSRRRDYRDHIAAMFRLADPTRTDQAGTDADIAFALDAKLVAALPAPSDDPEAEEHAMTAADLVALAPDLDWPAYLARVGAEHATLNVTVPSYLATVDAIVRDTSLAELRVYLRWQLLRALGPALPGPLADEHYRFATLSGVARGPRPRECELQTMVAMGVELSREFSLRSIGAARDRARPAAEAVRAELARAVAAATWLSPEARAVTAAKVQAISLEIGFPDHWPQTGTYALAPDRFLDNVLAARTFEQTRSWHRAGQRRGDDWENIVYPNAASGMAAARLTIPNGFPDMTSGSIVFTAALLRAPQFDPDAPLEVRNAGFGSLVGHELIHVVEEHEFDATGELRETWTPLDVTAHDHRRACVIGEADQFVEAGDLHFDGAQTYSENVADLSGVALAYAATERALGPSELDVRGPDGLTRAQRFFVAYAQHWCRADRPAFARANVRDDPHAPPRYRVDGPLANLPAFARAFHCGPGSAMVREPRCSVW